MFTNHVATNPRTDTDQGEPAGAACDGYRGTKEGANAYGRAVCRVNLKLVPNVVVGLPMMGTFEGSSSTFHMLVAKAA